MKTYIVAIDGNCGSGKSTLASLMQKRFECNVVHMDDYYLPFSMRENDWEQVPAGNMDVARFREQVLIPAKEGKSITYQPYFCRENRYRDAVILEPKQLLVVEGSYSHHPSLTDCYHLKIFLTCSKEEQKKRLMNREGERFQFYEKRWIPMEERYYQVFSIMEQADRIVETRDFDVYNELLHEIHRSMEAFMF